MAGDFLSTLRIAADFDPTVGVRNRHLRILQAKHVRAMRYSRQRLFSRMVQGQVSIFYDYPLSIRGAAGGDRQKFLSEGVKKGFPKNETFCVQAGPSRQRYRITVPALMRRWEGGRAVVSVTDLHFRDTKFAGLIDTSALSDFNILCGVPELVERLEMMTLVVSSKGNLTDIHADDCDGSNHCFLGKKLWLAWDRIEGQARGFQDADRDYVMGQAAFDMETFVSLRSSRWFVVEADKTLFLPGHLAHKVITIEPYIGVGSFHVALPGYLNSLKRWLLHDAPDVKPNLEKINQAVVRTIHHIQHGPRNLQKRWGLFYMNIAVERWKRKEIRKTREALLRNPIFAAFMAVAARDSSSSQRRFHARELIPIRSLL